MTVPTGGRKTLLELSDDELRIKLHRETQSVQSWGVNDLLAEIRRRTDEQHARWLRRLTLVIAGSSVAYTLVTLLLVIVTMGQR